MGSLFAEINSADFYSKSTTSTSILSEIAVPTTDLLLYLPELAFK